MSRIGLIAVVLLASVPVLGSAAEKPVSLQEWAKKSEGRFPYSIAFKNQKAGYPIEDWKVGKHDGKDVGRAPPSRSAAWNHARGRARISGLGAGASSRTWPRACHRRCRPKSRVAVPPLSR